MAEDAVIERLIQCLPTYESYGEHYNKLAKAFKDCNVDVLKLFIKLGVSPNICLYDGHSPLTLLIAKSSSEFWQDVASLLLENGADPNQCSPKGTSVLSMLVSTGEPELVSLALNKGADIEGIGPGGETALITAVHYKQVQCLKILLERGANPNVPSKDGTTALMWAAGRSNGLGSQKCLAAVKALIAYGADPSKCNDRGYTPLMSASLIREATTVQILIEAGSPLEARDYRGETALFKAVYSNCIESVQYLLVAGADVNSRCKNDRTPLMVGNSLKILNLLLDYKSDVTAVDCDGLIAMHHYCKANKPQFVRALAISRSKLQSRCIAGNTPLQIAVRSRASDCIKILIDRGANVSVKNNDSINLFHEIIIPWDFFHTIDVFPIVNTPSLLQEIQNYLLPASTSSADLIRELLAKEAKECDNPAKECDNPAKGGVRPLMLAALCGDNNLCRLLIDEGGADPHAEDDKGRNVLSYACRGGQMSVVHLLLQKYSALVNCQDSDHNLPIFYAAQFEYMDIVQLLMLDFAFFMCFTVHQKNIFQM